ncbi:MAG: hypothetical protein ABFC57_18405, partial [Veillonellales bacterium]
MQNTKKLYRQHKFGKPETNFLSPRFLQKQVHVKTPADLQAMKKEERDAYLRIIKRVNGVSTRQIARLT